MVCVFPQPVAPYAKTVALYPSSTLSSRGFVVASYTSLCVVVSSKTRSNAKVWSFTRLPMGPVVERVNLCTGLSSGGSKMLGACQPTHNAMDAGCSYRHFSSRTLITGLMPFELSVGLGAAAKEPSPKNNAWSSHLDNCAASRIVNGRTRTVTEMEDAPSWAMVAQKRGA
jgi:hypothetical protein